MRAYRHQGAKIAALLLSLLLLGAAGAQYAFSRLTLAGRDSQAIVLGGAEYASQVTLQGVVSVSREDPYVRVQGLGHELILPIDLDNTRAATDFNTVQLDTARIKARTATVVNGELYLPLDTLARGLGAQYKTGNFTIPPSAITNVASRAGQDSDRIVLDLARAVPYVDRVTGGTLNVVLKGVSAHSRTYATRGGFVPKFEVKDLGNGSVQLSLPLGAGAGYRIFRVVRPGSVRLVIDVGPGLPRNVPVLSDLPRAPLIVLDPSPSGSTTDAPLEVARAAGELLSKAGWQVKLTRTAAGRLPVEQRELLARRSQVFVTLSVGRFPGAVRQGLTLYQPTGDANAQVINRYRDESANPLVASAVGSGETKRLSELFIGELGTRGLKAGGQSIARMYLPAEAPHAAFELELGWPQDAGDRAALTSAQRTTKVSEALALSVASFLKARAANLSGSGQ